jgi:hypothetical protein
MVNLMISRVLGIYKNIIFFPQKKYLYRRKVKIQKHHQNRYLSHQKRFHKKNQIK